MLTNITLFLHKTNTDKIQQCLNSFRVIHLYVYINDEEFHVMNWITITRKYSDIRKHWTVIWILLGLISSVDRTSHHRDETLQLRYSPYRSEVTSNKLVMVIARPINLNVSCKLHLYSLQNTRSPPGPCLHKRIRNTHLRNYYDLKDKDIDVSLLFI